MPSNAWRTCAANVTAAGVATTLQGLAEFVLEAADAKAHGGGREREAIRCTGKAANSDAHLQYSEGFYRGPND